MQTDVYLHWFHFRIIARSKAQRILSLHDLLEIKQMYWFGSIYFASFLIKQAHEPKCVLCDLKLWVNLTKIDGGLQSRHCNSRTRHCSIYLPLSLSTLRQIKPTRVQYSLASHIAVSLTSLLYLHVSKQDLLLVVL